MSDAVALPMIRRFSSRLARFSHVFLKDRLQSAREYRRIAGYFRSSIFELVGEEIGGVDRVQIVCNSELDPRTSARPAWPERWPSRRNGTRRPIRSTAC